MGGSGARLGVVIRTIRCEWVAKLYYWEKIFRFFFQAAWSINGNFRGTHKIVMINNRMSDDHYDPHSPFPPNQVSALDTYQVQEINI